MHITMLILFTETDYFIYNNDGNTLHSSNIQLFIALTVTFIIL